MAKKETKIKEPEVIISPEVIPTDKVEVPAKEELVTMTKSQLQKLLDDIDNVKKTNNILLQVADKRALSNYQSRNKGEIQYDVNVRSMDIDGEEKVIVAWKTLKDRVYKDSDLRWREEQTVRLYFLDGTTKDMSLYDFNQRFTYIKCKLIGEIKDSVSGETVLKLLRNDNGEEVQISAPYVN